MKYKPVSEKNELKGGCARGLLHVCHDCIRKEWIKRGLLGQQTLPCFRLVSEKNELKASSEKTALICSIACIRKEWIERIPKKVKVWRNHTSIRKEWIERGYTVNLILPNCVGYQKRMNWKFIHFVVNVDSATGVSEKNELKDSIWLRFRMPFKPVSEKNELKVWIYASC